MSKTPRNTKINLPVKISMLYTAEFYKILHIIFFNPYKVTLFGNKIKVIYKLMLKYEKSV